MVGINFSGDPDIEDGSRPPATVLGNYATGSVAGTGTVGGLVGQNGHSRRGRFVFGAIRYSYATGRVSGGGNGLVGSDDGTITSVYWDSSTSGDTTGTGARTTAQLQAPTGYSGIYGSWSVDVDDDGTNDDPWHFGTSTQYPVLKADVDDTAGATWQEFGRQLRVGPTLTASSSTTTLCQTQVALTWTAVDVSHWSPAPGVAYTVTFATTRWCART